MMIDDVIVNSYARMCQVYRRNSFICQDSCLSSPYHNQYGGFKSVDQKFIQIINRDNAHWFCVSNALSFITEPHVVEVFDSLVTADSIRSVNPVPFYLSRIILQLKPHTSCIRYVKTQRQAENSLDCGPWALGFLWALSHGHHPRMYDHLQGKIIRNRVRESFIKNRFCPPCNTPPRNNAKEILKEFNLDTQTHRFKSI